jgi:ribonuclease HI
MCLMRPDEARVLIAFLPEELRDRADSVRRNTYRHSACDPCRTAGELIVLCLTAAQYDDIPVASNLLNDAENAVAGHSHSDDLSRHDRSLLAGLHGLVSGYRPADDELIAATDASWKGAAGGYAYVATDGRWGLRSHSRYHLDPTGPSRALVNELRAVEFLLAAVEAPGLRITVLVDSAPALGFLAHWRTGDTSRMPRGYSLRPRTTGTPTLVRLADRIRRTDVVFQHVKGHHGHPLNEAADSLSAMARRWVGEHFDVSERAAGLVKAFLRDWHAGPGALPVTLPALVSARDGQPRAVRP